MQTLLRIIGTLAFLGLSMVDASGATYSVSATRLSSNVYRLAGTGNYILRTRYCYEYAYSENATLTMTASTGNYDGSIVFASGTQCDVKGAYGPMNLNAGLYSASLSYEDDQFYSDALQSILIETFACYQFQYFAQSTLSLGFSGKTYLGGANIGTVAFPYANCNLVGIYSLLNLAGGGGGSVGVPGSPTSVSALAGDRSATIQFSPPTSNGGGAITSYNVQCSASGSTFTSTKSSSPITISGMTNGVTYGCSVSATNSAGTGPSSAIVSVTPRVASESSTSTVYNIPSTDNADQPFVRIYNPATTGGTVRVTLYDQTGVVLGNPASVLAANIPPNSVKVVTASDIASAVGATTWTGRAWMQLDADFPNVRAMNLIRSGLLLSMSCLESDAAYYIPNPTATSEQAYIRLYNPTATAGAVRGTLYDESGNQLGTANATLVASLGAHAVQVMNASQIATAVGVTTWTGRAWMKISSDVTSLKVMNTHRDLSTNRLANASCGVESTGTSADVLNLPSPTASTTASVRIYNKESSSMNVTGAVYGESGTLLGSASLGTVPPHGVLVLSNSQIASLIGTSSWTGRAWMRVTSNVTGLEILTTTRQQSDMEMSCSEDEYAFNIPDASNSQDHPFIRIYNTSAASTNVTGTLYHQDGTVLGTHNSVLISNMPAKSVTQFTAGMLAAAVGVSSWTGRAWLKLTTPASGLRILNILEDQVSGNWANMSCVTN